jgi:hypothetical protein
MGKGLIGLLLGVVVLTLAWGLTVMLLGPFPGITKANVERIRNGMTGAEAIAILGQPAVVTTLTGWCGREHIDMGLPIYAVQWRGEAGKATVLLNVDGVVTDANFEPAPDPPFSVGLRSCLGL